MVIYILFLVLVEPTEKGVHFNTIVQEFSSKKNCIIAKENMYKQFGEHVSAWCELK